MTSGSVDCFKFINVICRVLYSNFPTSKYFVQKNIGERVIYGNIGFDGDFGMEDEHTMPVVVVNSGSRLEVSPQIPAQCWSY